MGEGAVVAIVDGPKNGILHLTSRNSMVMADDLRENKKLIDSFEDPITG